MGDGIYFVRFFTLFLFVNGYTVNLEKGKIINFDHPGVNSFNMEPLKYNINRNKDNLIGKQIINNDLQKEISWRWPLGDINYYVDISSYDYLIAHRIRVTMNLIETSSCLKFVPILLKPTEGNSSWLHITNPEKERDCVHETSFKEHGEVTLVLGYDCLRNADVLHSLLHGIGFNDEVTHPERDNYVRIMWSNIQPAYRHLFNIKEGVPVTVEYDPLSVMHFSDRDYTMNGQATIEPAVSGLIISPSGSLSQLDKLRLRLLFGHVCNNREVSKLIKTCQNTLIKAREDVNISNSQSKNEVNETGAPMISVNSESGNIEQISEEKLGEEGTETPNNTTGSKLEGEETPNNTTESKLEGEEIKSKSSEAVIAVQGGDKGIKVQIVT